jgi:1-acyl-sn-glycerol-3-phosphate acyltransferase
MMFFRFIFLKRQWQEDQSVLTSALEKFRNRANESLLLLLFPEGTILTQNTIGKALEFAKKRGLVRFSIDLPSMYVPNIWVQLANFAIIRPLPKIASYLALLDFLAYCDRFEMTEK